MPKTYCFGERIATGGMAEIYRGQAKLPGGALGPQVALKRLHPHLLDDRAIVQMFLNEARITQRVVHPNVVRILDVLMVGREPVIAMELLNGSSFGDLRTVAAEAGRHIPLGIILRILCEACRGLDAAHRAVDGAGVPLRIVHRDFTPDNIHVSVEGHIKVIDFGIATAASFRSGTQPGTLKGKIFYMSPEMIAGGAVDHRADIFAAGVMLYEQLCGRRPFTGQSTEEVFARIAEGRPRAPRSFDPSVPERLEQICLRALARNPADRFRSLLELIRDIEKVRGTAGVASAAEVGAYVRGLFPALPLPVEERRTHPLLNPVRGRSFSRLILGGVLVGAVGLGAALRYQTSEGKRGALKTFVQPGDATVPQLRRAAQRMLTLGQGTGALTAAVQLTDRDPADVEGYLLQGRAETLLRHGKRAEAALGKAQTLAPGDARVDVARADLLEAQGDLPAALASLNQAIQKKPEGWELLLRKGELLSSRGLLEPAASALKAGLAHHPDARAEAELGSVRLRQGHNSEALMLLRLSLKQAPDLAVAHYFLGATLLALGDFKGAERAYREADHLDPTDARALTALCELQARTGKSSSKLSAACRP